MLLRLKNAPISQGNLSGGKSCPTVARLDRKTPHCGLSCLLQLVLHKIIECQLCLQVQIVVDIFGTLHLTNFAELLDGLILTSSGNERQREALVWGCLLVIYLQLASIEPRCLLVVATSPREISQIDIGAPIARIEGCNLLEFLRCILEPQAHAISRCQRSPQTYFTRSRLDRRFESSNSFTRRLEVQIEFPKSAEAQRLPSEAGFQS